MPISGLVIRLAPSDALARDAVAQLDAHEHIELGPCEHGRLAVVVETPSQELDKQLWIWINDLPGVEFVDVVYVHLDDDDVESGEPGNRTRTPSVMESAP